MAGNHSKEPPKDTMKKDVMKKDMMKISKRERREIAQALSLLTQVGLNMAICVVLGVWIGKLLDGWLGTSPIFLIVFAFMGVGAAFMNLYKLVMKRWMK